MNYDFDTLYNESRRENFSLGKDLFYNDAVKSAAMREVGGKTEIDILVKAEQSYRGKIIFDESGSLYDYECDCGECDHVSGPCKHVIAGALSYEEKHPAVESSSFERKSDADVFSLVVDYNRKKRLTIAAEDSVKAEVVPYVNFDGGINLSLTVGYRKQYVVKDIWAFAADFKECRYKRYGVSLEIYHAMGSFSPLSQSLIDFIVKCVDERAFDASKPTQTLSLTGGEFDRLFEMYSGKLLNKTRSEHYALAPFDAALPVKYSVSAVNGGYITKMNAKSLAFVKGRDYVYAILGNRIYRVTTQHYLAVKELSAALKGGRELFVSKADIVQFYNSVITTVAQYSEVISEGVDFVALEIPRLSCQIYLKSENKVLSAEIHASYFNQNFDLLSDTYNASHLRDWESEDAIRTTLAKYFPEYPALEIYGENDIFTFLKRGVRELCSYAEVFMTESMAKMRVRTIKGMKVGVRLSSNVLSVNLSSDEFTEEELKSILDAYKNNQKYVLLGGGFVDLDDRQLEALSEVLSEATDGEEGYILPAYYAPFVSSQLSGSEVSFEKDDNLEKLITSFENNEASTDGLPDSLKNTLRSYQKVGYNWLSKLSGYGFGGILADDMGLGKTLEVLALLSRGKQTALIVCPTTLVLNWQDEIKKFTPNLKSVIVTGSQSERKEIIDKRDNYDVVITSYDLIRRDYELYEGIEFDYAIADEAQNIKNPETKNAISLKTVLAKHKFALTGTPVENHLGELWSIFDFVMPGFLGSYRDFKENYEEGIAAGDDEAAERLKRLITPFILRRLKSDVLKELPPKVESKLSVPLSDEQRSLYFANMHQIKNSLRFDENANRVEVLSMIMRLRQICCHPSLAYPDYHGNSAKLDSCMELVTSAVENGHKILLFSQFTSMLDVIKSELARRNISFYILTGENPKSERLKMVKQFNEDDTSVFLISLKAGGTGLNLTGADIVIHYDPWWNESVMNQATDRAYRLGQNKSVQVYKLILEGTLEEKIHELQKKKSALSNMIVGKENDVKDIIRLIKEDN